MSVPVRTTKTNSQKSSGQSRGTQLEKTVSLVHEALRSPDQLFDKNINSVLAPTYDFDFSNMRIHTGSSAVKSTKSPHKAACSTVNIARMADGPCEIAVDRSLVGDALQSASRPLDDSIRQEMEPKFGFDFSKVRIHTGPVAAQSAKAVGAQAYTVDNDVVFGNNRYQPQIGSSKELIIHELSHVAQQEAQSTGHSTSSAGVRIRRKPESENSDSLVKLKKLSLSIDQLESQIQNDLEAKNSQEKINDVQWAVSWVSEVVGGIAGAFKGNGLHKLQIPEASAWNKSKQLLKEAKMQLKTGDVIRTAHALQSLSSEYIRTHEKLRDYFDNLVGGAEMSTTSLQIAVAAGAIAATIATGGVAAEAGLGLLGTSALIGTVGGAYGAEQQYAGQVGEMIAGSRKTIDMSAGLKRGLEDSITNFVGAFVGGALTKYATKSFGSYLGKIADNELVELGEALGMKGPLPRDFFLTRGQKMIAEFLGGVGSTPLTSAVSVVVHRITEGKFPTKEEFVSTVIHEMIQGGALQLFIGTILHGRGLGKTLSEPPHGGKGATPAKSSAPMTSHTLEAPIRAVPKSTEPSVKSPQVTTPSEPGGNQVTDLAAYRASHPVPESAPVSKPAKVINLEEVRQSRASSKSSAPYSEPTTQPVEQAMQRPMQMAAGAELMSPQNIKSTTSGSENLRPMASSSTKTSAPKTSSEPAKVLDLHNQGVKNNQSTNSRVQPKSRTINESTKSGAAVKKQSAEILTNGERFKNIEPVPKALLEVVPKSASLERFKNIEPVPKTSSEIKSPGVEGRLNAIETKKMATQGTNDSNGKKHGTISATSDGIQEHSPSIKPVVERVPAQKSKSPSSSVLVEDVRKPGKVPLEQSKRVRSTSEEIQEFIKQETSGADSSSESPNSVEDPTSVPDTRPAGELFNRTQAEYEEFEAHRERGNTFNTERENAYAHNEVTIDSPWEGEKGKRYRLDSYVPNKEIVSRKYPTDAKINPDRGIEVIAELINNYPQGARIADTPKNQAAGIAGQVLRGQHILEVPVLLNEVPEVVLEYAQRVNVVIRDAEGNIYK